MLNTKFRVWSTCTTLVKSLKTTQRCALGAREKQALTSQFDANCLFRTTSCSGISISKAYTMAEA